MNDPEMFALGAFFYAVGWFVYYIWLVGRLAREFGIEPHDDAFDWAITMLLAVPLAFLWPLIALFMGIKALVLATMGDQIG